MKTRNLTCIVCPRGCELTVTLDDGGKINEITGNACQRGVIYAKNECTDPKRMLTTTVATEDGALIPVRTSVPIPKALIFDAMRELSEVVAPKDAKIGDVLVENILATEADIIVTGKK